MYGIYVVLFCYSGRIVSIPYYHDLDKFTLHLSYAG